MTKGGVMRRPDLVELIIQALDATSKFEQATRNYEDFTAQKVKEYMDQGKCLADAEHLAGEVPLIKQAGRHAIWFREKANLYRGMAELVLAADQEHEGILDIVARERTRRGK
jgi:hypothetical protein